MGLRSDTAAGAKRLARHFIPVDDWLRLKLAYAYLRSLPYAGNRVCCPCCGGSFRSFLPGGVVPRPNARCPRCDSLERHRLLMLYLQNETDLFHGRLVVLHISPEPCLYARISRLPAVTYLPAGLGSALARFPVDITDIPYRDGYFDGIICSHVLEHVLDDRRGMRELHRVLKPRGWALLQVPVDNERLETYEDPSIVDPKDRERVFGQDDHVRIYGRDYADRLRAAGFEVEVNPYWNDFRRDAIRRFGLLEVEPIYRCSKQS